MSEAGARSVYCLGDVMLDVTARLSVPLAVGSDAPATITTQPGGSAANTACWLSRLGVPTAMIGRVGDDAPGREALQAFATAGVRTRVSVDPHRTTGTCLVLVAPDGERTMVPDAGANHGLSVADLPLLSPGDHLHVSGYSLFAPQVRDVARTALDTAVAAGATVSVGAASAAPLQVVGAAAFLSWLPASTLLFANEAEAAVLGDDGPSEVAELVVTRGAGGAGATRGIARWTSAAEPDVTVVDSTGAGDAFAAGYLAARRGGAEPDVALAAGHRCAAVAVTRLGARPD